MVLGPQPLELVHFLYKPMESEKDFLFKNTLKWGAGEKHFPGFQEHKKIETRPRRLQTPTMTSARHRFANEVGLSHLVPGTVPVGQHQGLLAPLVLLSFA